jgi:hypothetical protein
MALSDYLDAAKTAARSYKDKLTEIREVRQDGQHEPVPFYRDLIENYRGEIPERRGELACRDREEARLEAEAQLNRWDAARDARQAGHSTPEDFYKHPDGMAAWGATKAAARDRLDAWAEKNAARQADKDYSTMPTGVKPPGQQQQERYT